MNPIIFILYEKLDDLFMNTGGKTHELIRGCMSNLKYILSTHL